MTTFAFIALGICLLGLSTTEKPPKLIYNPSSSAPIGWYAVTHKDDYKAGDMVAAQIPDWAAKMAQARGYLPIGAPVIKTIIATPGTQYCIRSRTLIVPNYPPFSHHSFDSQEREMPVQPDGCRSLNSGEYLIGSTTYERSFDSRYFGSVEHADLIGTVELIGAVE
jgi:conjugative transfer signal peptidase TraF